MFEGKSLSIDKKAISFLLPLSVQTSKESTTEIGSTEIREIDEPMQQGCQSISLNHPLSFQLIQRNHTLSLLFKTKCEYFTTALFFTTHCMQLQNISMRSSPLVRTVGNLKSKVLHWGINLVIASLKFFIFGCGWGSFAEVGVGCPVAINTA